MKQAQFVFLSLVFLLLYLLSAPVFVQGGDTAELVGASYHKLIPHPPGYPLYLWLQHLWTHLFQVSTVFWRAAVLNSILGLGALILISAPLKKSSPFWFIPFLVLGLKFEFFEASILPDVFALHALLIALVGRFFLFSEGKFTQPLTCFLLALGFANHHTTTFLFPIYAFIFLNALRDKIELKSIVSYSLAGIGTCALLYLSLFLCQTTHPFSWNKLESLKDLFFHFVRKDYGSFQLAASSEQSTTAPFFYLIKSIWPVFLLLLCLIGLNFKQILSDKKLTVWLLSLLLTFLFPFFMNVTPDGVGEEVLLRFHVMPLIMTVIGISYLLLRYEYLRNQKVLILLLVLIPTTINLTHVPSFLKLRLDSTIEDYSTNLIASGVKHSPSVIVAESDSSFFAMRYLLLMNEELKHNKTTVVSLPLFFHPWYLEKVRSIHGNFLLENRDRVYQERQLKLNQDVLRPNSSHLNFIFTKGFKDTLEYKVTFLPLGRMVQPGNGTYFEEYRKPIQRFKPTLEDTGPQHFIKQKLFYEYSHYFLAQGFEDFSKDRIEEAKKDWLRAIETVPYCHAAMRNLCEISSTYEFCSELERFESLTKNFY